MTRSLLASVFALIVFAFGFLAPVAAEVTLLSRSTVISATAAGESVMPIGQSELFIRPTVRSVVSGDGRFVAFLSRADNLVSGQVGSASFTDDVFLFDRISGTTRMVSRQHGTTATPAGAVGELVISRDGSCVVFTSRSTSLVAGQTDSNNMSDLFVFDVATGQVTLVSHVAGTPSVAASVPSNGAFPVVSHDCRYIAYLSEASNLMEGQDDLSFNVDLFLFDRQTGTNTLVSHSAGEAATAATGSSVRPALSGDGRFVAFTSTGTNLVAGQLDLSLTLDVFLYDRTTGEITLVSHAIGSANQPGNGGSDRVAISADGNYLAYVSAADDLVPGHARPSGIANDVFLYERATGLNILASRSAASATTSGDASTSGLAPALSDDGRYTVFASAATNLVAGQVDAPGTAAESEDLFLFDRVTGVTTLVSHIGQLSPSTTAGNRFAGEVQMSADGGSVAFTSLSPLGYSDVGDEADVFLFRRDTGAVILVSRAHDTPNGPALGVSSRPAVSADGRYVAFSSHALDIAPFDANGVSDVFLYDRVQGGNAIVSRHAAGMASHSGNSSSSSGFSRGSAFSDDGRYVAFATQATDVFSNFGPITDEPQIVVADRLTGTLRLVSRTPECPECPGASRSEFPALSVDGQRVTFSSSSDLTNATGPTNGFQIYAHESGTGALSLLSLSATVPNRRANGNSTAPVTSLDGRTVAFHSRATDLVIGTDGNSDYDIFLVGPDVPMRLVSHAAGSPSVAGNGVSVLPWISGDGRLVAFSSQASNLVAGASDTNALLDVFLYDRGMDASILVSHKAGAPTVAGNGDSRVADMSRDGRFVLFVSSATDLVSGQVDTPDTSDLFLFDRTTGESTLVSRIRGTVATAATVVNQFGINGTLSRDGRYVAFLSQSTELVPGQADTSQTVDLFLFDRVSGETALVSHAFNSSLTAVQANLVAPRMSGDGRFVVWSGSAANLVPGQIDPHGFGDIFSYDRTTGSNRLISYVPTSPTTAGNGHSYSPDISADGRSIFFSSRAENLVANDHNSQLDTFLERGPTSPGAFFTLPPCRVADSRISNVPLSSGISRVLPSYAACGIPSTATAVSVNVTVVAGNTAGFLSLFPGDQPVPSTSTLNFRAGQVKANNAVARLALDGSGTLGIVASFASDGPVHFILDVNGYFE